MTTESTGFFNEVWPDLPAKIARNLGAKACIVMLDLGDGRQAIHSAGLNHMGVTLMLSNGIYMNLGDHKAAVLRGEAGEEAQRVAEQCDTEAA